MSDTSDLPVEREEEVPPVGPIEPDPIPTDEPIQPVDPNFVKQGEDVEPVDADDDV